MGLNKSNPTSVWSPNGNSLAVFVNALNDQLFLKDAIGNIQPLSDFIPNPSGTSPYQYDACTGSIKPVLGSNCTNGQYSTIGGGSGNSICAPTSFIGAGESNAIFVSNSFIGAGSSNNICSQWSAIVSGQDNCIGANAESFSFIGAGASNTILCGLSAIVSGQGNCSTGVYTFIGAGSCNITCENYTFVGSGNLNIAQRNNSVVVGGELNENYSRWGFIGGGYCNKSFNECFSTITGGLFNEACGKSSFIGGGCTNKAYCDFSVVVGGCENSALGFGSVVVGGCKNSACSTNSFIGGGTNALAYLYGMHTCSNGQITSLGDAQESKVITRVEAILSSGATAEMFLDENGTNLIIPQGENRAWNVLVNWVVVCNGLGDGTTGGLAVGDVGSATSSFFFKKVSSVSSISSIKVPTEHFDASMVDVLVNFSVGGSENLVVTLVAPTTAGTNSTFRAVASLELIEVAW